MTSVVHPHGARQIHLDFHTSRDIDDVASDFDPDVFGETLENAAVSSVNLFAKCHHGYSYYPTRVGTQHPGLKRDLLGEQIQVLHRRSIKAPVYVSVLWDDLAAEEHPEWVVTNRQGRQVMREPLSADSPLNNQLGWSTMDITSSYGDYVLSQLAELLDQYPVDGFWLDIVWVEPNYSPSAQKRMRASGVDMSDEGAVFAWARRGLLDWMARVRDLVAERAPEATLFFNGMVDADVADAVAVQSHLEVESLPTSGSVWGYMHFPVMSRFARTFGKPIVGMTGRFHKSWADFGGLKPLPQVTYETATILAAGGAVCIGDQLDPGGGIDKAVYDTIGQEFRRIRALERSTAEAVPIVEAVIVGSSRVNVGAVHREAVFTEGVEGAVQALTEVHAQFEIARGVPDPSATDYRFLIVPGDVELTDADWASLCRWALAGTTIVLEPGAARRASPAFAELLPVTEVRDSATDHNYVVAAELASGDIDPHYPYALYGPAASLIPTHDAITAGYVRPARFSRSWRHFTSHSQSPVGSPIAGPFVAVKGSVVVVAAPLTSMTKGESYWLYPLLLRAAIRLSSEGWIVESVASVQGEVSVHSIDTTGELIVHIVPFHAKRAFSSIPRLDKKVAIADTEIVLRPGFVVAEVVELPDESPLAYCTAGDTVTVYIPRLSGHAVVRLSPYAADRNSDS